MIDFDTSIVIDNSDLKKDNNTVEEIDTAHNSIEQLCADALKRQQREYEKAIENGKKSYPDSDFFIDRALRVSTSVHDPKIVATWRIRKECPTPTYDQAVFHYIKKEERIVYLWTLPSKESAQIMYKYPLDVPHEGKELLNHVIDFYEGKLDKLCKKLNKEDEKIANVILEVIDEQ